MDVLGNREALGSCVIFWDERKGFPFVRVNVVPMLTIFSAVKCKETQKDMLNFHLI